ncbi:MAG: glycosyltransferase family 2 protein [Alphaproteobacteria bacterium]
MTEKKLKFPLFTVVTITRNNLAGLQKTFNSIKNQSFTNFEWLVIDGNSSDNTVAFLQKQKDDKSHIFFIRYTSERDEGIYDAMNKGLKHAYGHYIIFMNAGDTFANAKILENIEPLTEKKPDFIYGDALETKKNCKKPITKPAKRYKNIPWGMFTHHQAMIYKKQNIKDLNIHYSLLYDIASDYDFTARYLMHAKKVIYIPKPICIFEHGGVSQQQAFKGRREQFLIREKLDMVSIQKNVMIFCAQTLSWEVKNRIPYIYKIIKKCVK